MQHIRGDAGQIHRERLNGNAVGVAHHVAVGVANGHDGVGDTGQEGGVHDHFGEVVAGGRIRGSAAVEDDFHVADGHVGERETAIRACVGDVVLLADDIDFHALDWQEVVEAVGAEADVV